MATTLLYQGHSSCRITASDGRVIYLDPFAGEGYDKPADLILVTHQHMDHKKTKLVTQNPGCVVITNVEALADDTYNSFDVGGIIVEAVEASNSHHDPKKCVGYILTVDGIKVYFAGDTSRTKMMESFYERRLDYALLPIDGFFNMDVKEAILCAQIIGARVNIPIHMKPGALFDQKRADTFDAPGRRIVHPGEEIKL